MNQEHSNQHYDMSSHDKEGSGDVEGQSRDCAEDIAAPKESAFKSLGWLDRLLALWILLAMIVGVLLGNFVNSVGPALKRGQFVGVSIPIGPYDRSCDDKRFCANKFGSDRSSCDDVSHPLQGSIRNPTYRV